MTDLTPDGPVHIAAGSSLRVSEGVMDPIAATVLVLESVADDGSGDVLIMVGCDLASSRRRLRDRVQHLVASQPQIDVEKIVPMRCTTTAPRACEPIRNWRSSPNTGWMCLPNGRITASRPDGETMSPVGFSNSPLRESQPQTACVEQPQARRRELRSWKRRRVAQPPGCMRDGRSRRSSAAWTGPTSATLKATKTIRSDCSITPYDAGGELTGVVVNVPCAAWGMGSRITADFWHETRP